MSRLSTLLEALVPLFGTLILSGVLLGVWAARLTYPFDLEWMEGGMLAHAWRLDHGLPLYVHPNPDFVPFVYPPLYPALVALLGKVFGLSMTLGRSVSLAGTLAAAAAVAFGVRRGGGPWPLAVAAGAVFLGTYPQSGAFYDLVRPDALAVALAAFALVLAPEEHRWAPVGAGLLLAASFLTKQNAALFGVPIALGLALRDWRAALKFVAASAGPALLAVALLQWWSDGQYLVWMLEVPASHPMAWERARVDVPREWGTALPVALLVLTVEAVLDTVRRQSSVPKWAAAGLPVWLGMVAAWWGTYEVPPASSGLQPMAYGSAYLAGIAVPLSWVLLGIGLVADRVRTGAAPGLPGWRWAYDQGVLAAAAAMALSMRVHESGFVNVHTPLFLVLALRFGSTLARWRVEAPTPTVRGLAVGVVTAQLLWSAGLVDRQRLVPDPADTAIGWKFVEELKKVDGQVFSPFAAWLPVYAGKPPSMHAMGVWDSNLPGGPYKKDLDSIQHALARHRWAVVLGGSHRLIGDLNDHYRPTTVIVPNDDPRFQPRTGFMARPWRILVPREKGRRKQ